MRVTQERGGRRERGSLIFTITNVRLQALGRHRGRGVSGWHELSFPYRLKHEKAFTIARSLPFGQHLITDDRVVDLVDIRDLEKKA